MKTLINHQKVVHKGEHLNSKVYNCGRGIFVYDGQWVFQEKGPNERGFVCKLRTCDFESASQDEMVTHLQNHAGKLFR